MSALPETLNDDSYVWLMGYTFICYPSQEFMKTIYVDMDENDGY